MSDEVVAVLARPMPDPARSGGLLRKYRTLVEFKANPRSQEYMLDLLEERRAGARVLRWEEDADERLAVRGAREVVLLYPDATGLGFARIESAVRKLARPDATVTAINGRRREFALDRRTRRGLLVRRAAERSMVGEIAASAVLVALIPILLVVDHLRGRR